MNKILLYGLCMIFLISSVFAYELEFYHSDHLGSPVVVTDENQSVLWSSDYDIFGEAVNEQGDGDLKYNQKEKDDTGLLYYGARYYNADTGRFITADTVKGEMTDLQSQNLYVYVQNNPMKYIDPTGNQKEESNGLSLKWAIKNGLLEIKKHGSLKKAAYFYASKSGAGAIGYATEDDLRYTSGRYRGSGSNKDTPDILAMYLGLEPISLPKSEYSPTSLSKYKGVSLYSIKEWSYVVPFSRISSQLVGEGSDSYVEQLPDWSTSLLKKMLTMESGQIVHSKSSSSAQLISTRIDSAHYTVSIGKDEGGVYISLFDVWDFGGSYTDMWEVPKAQRWQVMAMRMVGKPIGFYDRHYLDHGEIQQELLNRGEQLPESQAR